MAGRKVAVYVKCPYYRQEEGMKLCCEGIIEGTRVHHIFATKQARIDFERLHCKNMWKKCPIAILVEQKYRIKEGI